MPSLRVEMRVEIARLHNEIGATMIYVTHDQVEAMTLADKIVVLRAGRIEQVGKPLDLYNDPDNRFVAGFIGSPAMNFFDGQVDAGQRHRAGAWRGACRLPRPAPAVSGAITVGLRPNHLRLAPGDSARRGLCRNGWAA
jgi:lactose/L-arabinose transport system ATP-binding protein